MDSAFSSRQLCYIYTAPLKSSIQLKIISEELCVAYPLLFICSGFENICHFFLWLHFFHGCVYESYVGKLSIFVLFNLQLWICRGIFILTGFSMMSLTSCLAWSAMCILAYMTEGLGAYSSWCRKGGILLGYWDQKHNVDCLLGIIIRQFCVS